MAEVVVEMLLQEVADKSIEFHWKAEGCLGRGIDGDSFPCEQSPIPKLPGQFWNWAVSLMLLELSGAVGETSFSRSEQNEVNLHGPMLERVKTMWQ